MVWLLSDCFPPLGKKQKRKENSVSERNWKHEQFHTVPFIKANEKKRWAQKWQSRAGTARGKLNFPVFSKLFQYRYQCLCFVVKELFWGLHQEIKRQSNDIPQDYDKRFTTCPSLSGLVWELWIDFHSVFTLALEIDGFECKMQK